MHTLKVLMAGMVFVAAAAAPGRAQVCTGDCSEDLIVTVDEIVRIVNIALGEQPPEICASGDTDGNGMITVEEIIQAVNAALLARKVKAEGDCLIPGTSNEEPLQACASGTTVNAYRCLDRANCLEEEEARSFVGSTVVGGAAGLEEGEFRFEPFADCEGTSTFVYVAEVAEAQGYRTVDFGNVSSQGGRAAGEAEGRLQLNPLSEATVRLVDENGLENFGGETFEDVFAAVEAAIPADTFVGADAGAAAAAATQMARENSNVQETIARVLRHDVAVSTSIDPVGNMDLYKFTLYERTTVVLQMSRSTGALAPCLQVLTGNLERVCGDQSVRLDLTLNPGTYQVLAEDRDSNAIGSYSLYYLRLRPEDVEPLTAGDPVVEAIGPTGDLDGYGFRVTRLSRVIVQATQSTGAVQPCVELWQATSNGAVLVAEVCAEGISPLARVDEEVGAGNYIVVVGDQGAGDVGSYTLQLTVLPVPTSTPTPTRTATGLPSATPTLTPSPTVTARRTTDVPEGLRLGSEFGVNDASAADQGWPDVAVSRDTGEFVVVWYAEGPADADGDHVGRRFAPGGSPVTGEFLIREGGGLEGREIGLQPDGTLVVVWSERQNVIAGLRFHRLGDPVGPEFVVSEAGSYQDVGDIGVDEAGNFVVVWEREEGSPFQTSVFGRRYKSGGTPLGPEFLISESADQPRVAMLSTGFVVVWDGPDYRILGQRYDRDGNPIGGRIQVGAPADSFDGDHASNIAADDEDRFVVVWHRGWVDFVDIFGQRFRGDGMPLGAEFEVNTFIPGIQYEHSIAASGAGEFFAAWANYPPQQRQATPGDAPGIVVRGFDKNGVPFGPEFRVNTVLEGHDQDGPDISGDGKGNFVVVWEDFGWQQGDHDSVFVRLLYCDVCEK